MTLLGLSLKPDHLRRYKDVVRLVLKYGRADMLKGAPVGELAGDAEPVSSADSSQPPPEKAQEFANELERLGPTFIKLGQLLSTRPELMPPEYIQALSRLQDRVEPFDFQIVQQIIREEVGAKASQIFDEIEEKPMAVGSLGQVHAGRLRDGRRVAVKIQRPDIVLDVHKDLDALGEIARFLEAHTETGRRYGFQGMMEELRKALMAELDYRQEARNLQAFRDNLASFERIVIPRVIDDFSTMRVLTMDHIQGHKVTALSPVVLLELDRRALAEELSRAYLHQIIVDGLFHADPHPGNVLVTDDGRLALIDVGMVARVPPKMQERLLKMLLAISEARGEDAAAAALELSTASDDADTAQFERDAADFVMRNQETRLQQVSTGRLILEFHALASRSGLRLPSEFTMMGKALLNLDIVTRTLDPAFDPAASIRRHAGELMTQRMRQHVSWGNIFHSVLEAGEFAQRLPERLNRIFERIANSDFSVDVDAIDERELIRGMQKIANRITVGLILAALIIGAALMMRIETTFTLLEYPGLAIILFACAALGGVMLVWTILRSDR